MNKALWSAVTLLAFAALGCGTEPPSGGEVVLSCDQLFETAPTGTEIDASDQPRLLNREDIGLSLAQRYKEPGSYEAVVQLLAQPDGNASHGCVRRSSGEEDFDWAALQVASETARFRPAQLDGTAVNAWVVFTIAGGRGGES